MDERSRKAAAHGGLKTKKRLIAVGFFALLSIMASMTQEQINVDLFDQVKKLQDYKRRAEAETLKMAHENDTLRGEMSGAAALIYKLARSNDDYIAASHYKSISLDNSELSEPSLK